MSYNTEISGFEPVTMQQVKDHLRVTWEEEDAFIYSLLSAAREYVEKTTSQAVIPQTVKAYFPAMPLRAGFLELPLSNAVSITSVKYLDGAGVQQTVDSADYYLTVGQPSKVYFPSGYPGATDRPDSVEIIYEAGFGAAPYKPFPQALKSAILILVGDMYENREAQNTQRFEQNATVDRLLNQAREMSL
jgi:uncharacterized phiE125 gp8 family phage protein